jgi:SAM-dependent methyltransferase
MTEQESTSASEAEVKADLQREYEMRFSASQQYRNDVWKILTADFFQSLIPPESHVLDLGCGWGEFINNIVAKKKYGMDLNPESRQRLLAEVEFLEQDCSKEWGVRDASLDCVFTSNFFEHLRSKDDLRRTVAQIRRCLRPGGQLICMGPNIRYSAGAYWDFWDHHLPLTDLALGELLELVGFQIDRSLARFLPFQMVRRRPAPLSFVRLYLKLPFAWPFFGKQFLVIARVPPISTPVEFTSLPHL